METVEPQQSDDRVEGATVTPLFSSDQPNIRVRGARLDDVEWIREELRAFAKFYGTRRSIFPADDHAATFVERMIAQHLFIVAETANGVPLGFIAGFVMPHVFNPEVKVLSECFWWVKPEYRGSRAGALLFKNYVEWGRANVDWVTMTLEAHSPVRPEALVKRGFRLQETTFLLETER